MSEENKIDRHEVRQCWGRLMQHSWEIAAAHNLLRGLAYEDEDEAERDFERIVICNGLFISSSLMMTDLEAFQDLLGFSLPDWDEVTEKQLGELLHVRVLGHEEKHATNGA